MTRLLFRLDGLDRAPSAALPEGLRRHLAQADLLACAMQIGARRQAYVALHGCAGCAIGRCAPGCRADLLGRALQVAFGPAARLAPVPKGLAARPYQRLALALPRAQAQALDGELLHAWAEARLTLHWHRSPGPARRVVAALAVGADGPDPAATLRDRGWRALTLPGRLGRIGLGLACAPLPPGLPLAGRWAGDPALLLSDQAAPEARPSEPLPEPSSQELAGVRESTYLHLRDILEGRSALARADLPAATAPQSSDVQPAIPQSATARGWPAGPGEGRAAMLPADVAALIEAALAATAPAGDEPGLTRKRVAALLDERHKEHALVLLLWIEQAGLLAPPLDRQQPFRRPRRLAVARADQAAAPLLATPRPTADELRAAKASGL